MTNNNDRSNNRLDRIEAIVESNARAIQGILEQQATDRLKREEEKAQHEQRMRFLLIESKTAYTNSTRKG